MDISKLDALLQVVAYQQQALEKLARDEHAENYDFTRAVQHAGTILRERILGD